MELDEYKIRTYQRFNSAFPEKSITDLKVMMHKKVDTVVEKIKKSVKLEIVFALVFVLFIGYVLLRYPGTYVKILALGTLGFCLAFIVNLILLYRKFNAYYASSLSVRENVEHLIVIIQKFTRLYFQITMIFLPVTFLLVFITVTADRNYSFTSIPAEKMLIYAIAASAWCVIMYYFTKWYVKILYGKHLEDLNGHYEELQNTSGA